MDVFARLVLCPREFATYVRILLESLPVACIKCRSRCYYQGLTNEQMIDHFCKEVTFSPIDDEEE